MMGILFRSAVLLANREADLLLMMEQDPQRGWRSRTRVVCAPRSVERSEILDGHRSGGTSTWRSDPFLLGRSSPTRCRSGGHFCPFCRGETLSCLGTCFARQGEREVTDRVNRPFHAPIHFPRAMRSRLMEILKPTPLRGLQLEKLNKNFPFDRRET